MNRVGYFLRRPALLLSLLFILLVVMSALFAPGSPSIPMNSLSRD